MIVKDATVLILLGKTSFLEKACEMFKQVIIPESVKNEILKGKEKGFADAIITGNLIRENKIEVKKAEMKEIKKFEEFGLFGGEAEAVALYFKENADYIASDDNAVRKNRVVLGLDLVGTPSIIAMLARKKLINRKKAVEGLEELKKIGYFHEYVIDRIKEEFL